MAGPWDLVKQQKVNDAFGHAPSWVQWLYAAGFVLLVVAIVWFRFGPAKPDARQLRAAVELALDDDLLGELEQRAGVATSSGLIVYRPQSTRIALQTISAERSSWGSPGEGRGQASASVPATNGSLHELTFRWHRAAGGKIVVDELRMVGPEGER